MPRSRWPSSSRSAERHLLRVTTPVSISSPTSPPYAPLSSIDESEPRRRTGRRQASPSGLRVQGAFLVRRPPRARASVARGRHWHSGTLSPDFNSAEDAT
jgi:hypothetical protein